MVEQPHIATALAQERLDLCPGEPVLTDESIAPFFDTHHFATLLLQRVWLGKVGALALWSIDVERAVAAVVTWEREHPFPVRRRRRGRPNDPDPLWLWLRLEIRADLRQQQRPGSRRLRRSEALAEYLLDRMDPAQKARVLDWQRHYATHATPAAAPPRALVKAVKRFEPRFASLESTLAQRIAAVSHRDTQHDAADPFSRLIRLH